LNLRILASFVSPDIWKEGRREGRERRRKEKEEEKEGREGRKEERRKMSEYNLRILACFVSPDIRRVKLLNQDPDDANKEHKVNPAKKQAVVKRIQIPPPRLCLSEAVWKGHQRRKYDPGTVQTARIV
ncbi:FAS-associated factor 2, partial [Ophiophagus hannah]